MIRRLTLVVSVFLLVGPTFANDDAARGGHTSKSDGGVSRARPFTGVAHVVQTYASPVLRPASIGWDGASIWFVDDRDQMIHKMNPSTWTEVDVLSAPAASYAFGLDHDGMTLWGDTDSPEQLYQMNDSSGVVLNSFASPHGAPNGVACDAGLVWHSGCGADLTLMDPVTGTVVRTIPAPGNRTPRGLEMVDGSLWVVDANTYPDDAIYRLDPVDGSVLESYLPVDASFGLIYGIAHDGTKFWMTDMDTAQVHILEFEVLLVFYDGFESGGLGEWSAASP